MPGYKHSETETTMAFLHSEGPKKPESHGYRLQVRRCQARENMGATEGGDRGHGRGRGVVLIRVKGRKYFPQGRAIATSLTGTRSPPRPVSPPQDIGNRLAPEQNVVNHWPTCLPPYSKFGLKTVCLLRQKIQEQKPFQRRTRARIPRQFHLLCFDLLTNKSLP